MIGHLRGKFAEAKQVFIGTTLILLGLIAAIIGAIIGLVQKR